MRRVVTGVDATGAAAIISDGVPPRTHDFKHIPGHSMSVVWRTVSDGPMSYADRTSDDAGILPGPGETVCLMVKLSPGSVMRSDAFDAQAAAAERRAFAPDFQQCFEPDNPGFHTTPTIDYIVLLSGELWLEVDNGASTRVLPGDVVVQHANRHAWRNRTDSPATFCCVLIGTR